MNKPSEKTLRRAIKLDRLIKKFTNELAEIKAELVKIADETDIEFSLPNGQAISVTFPDDCLVKSPFCLHDGVAVIFREKEMVKLGPVKELAGNKFTLLFQELYKPAKGFRDLVPKLLPKDTAKKLVNCLTEKASPQVRFKNAPAPAK